MMAGNQRSVNGAAIAAEAEAKEILRQMSALKARLNEIKPTDPEYATILAKYNDTEDQFLEIFYGALMPSMAINE